MPQKTKILFTEFVTHDVKRFILSKPRDYNTVPGSSAQLSLQEPEWLGVKRPFTLTSLNDDLVLEFMIKRYDDHNGVTKRLHELESGTELLISDPWDSFDFKGRGIFIAGGVGITPFLARMRDLHKKGELAGYSLIFSNKTESDIIVEKELRHMFKDTEKNLILTLTREKSDRYEQGRVDAKFIEKHISDFTQNFYVCGPRAMVNAVSEDLRDFGVESENLIF